MVLLVNADSLKIPLADESVHCVVTSPPYWGLRDYGISDQLGLEPTPEEYIANMVQVFRQIWRVLRKDGTVWLNLADTYAGGGRGGHSEGKLSENWNPTYPKAIIPTNLKPKDLIGIPWRVALALQADGWWLRSDIIWHKPNPMPESVTDRPTKAHEYLFLLTKSTRYFYDAEAVAVPCSQNTHSRISQDLEKQIGSYRANGGNKTNGPMKAVIKGSTRKIAKSGSGIKANNSFESALALKVTTRNRRSVWTIPTCGYPGAHFATYPPALVEPCIKAGTSEKGVCPVCGAPWVRMTKPGTTRSWHNHIDDEVKGQRDESNEFKGENYYKNYRPPQTTGWTPTCDHDAEPIPAVVLDPFVGSGTTLQVARSLGRHGIGLDLSWSYLYNQARTRLELDKLADWGIVVEAEANLADLPLFRSSGLDNH